MAEIKDQPSDECGSCYYFKERATKCWCAHPYGPGTHTYPDGHRTCMCFRQRKSVDWADLMYSNSDIRP